MQGTQVQSLVQEDSTCCGATKPVHNYWAHIESTSHNNWTLSTRACAPQEEKPPNEKRQHRSEDSAEPNILN